MNMNPRGDSVKRLSLVVMVLPRVQPVVAHHACSRCGCPLTPWFAIHDGHSYQRGECERVEART